MKIKLLVITALVIMVLLAVLGVFFYGAMMEEKGWCACMDNQPGINTHWTGWKCQFESDPFENLNPEEWLRYEAGAMDWCRTKRL